jgi:hypothetical protein
MKLYHLSPKKFRTIDPGMSQGKLRRVWLCEQEYIRLLKNHLDAHHGTNMKYVYECDISITFVRKWRQGIYITDKVIHPLRMWKYSDYLLFDETRKEETNE